MQRDWTDPRDGKRWLVTLSPLGGWAAGDRGTGGRPSTIAFHRPGQRPSWTRCDFGDSLPQPEDQTLMDLLDAARRAHQRPLHRLLRASSSHAALVRH